MRRTKSLYQRIRNQLNLLLPTDIFPESLYSTSRQGKIGEACTGGEVADCPCDNNDPLSWLGFGSNLSPWNHVCYNFTEKWGWKLEGIYPTTTQEQE